MKTCSRCKVQKELSDFSFHTKREGKLQTRCKKCLSIDRYERLKDPVKAKTLRASVVRASTKYLKKEKRMFPNKYFARRALNNAVNTGKVEKGKCKVCGSEKTEAHHHAGYEKENWLVVTWLCNYHHRKEHEY